MEVMEQDPISSQTQDKFWAGRTTRVNHTKKMPYLLLLLATVFTNLSVIKSETPQVITENIIMQLKNVPGYKIPKKNDGRHTMPLFQSTVERFLLDMLKTVPHTSSLSQIHNFQVDVQNQVLGIPKNNSDHKRKNERSGGNMRRLDNTGSIDEASSCPIHINVTLSGEYTPSPDYPIIKKDEYLKHLETMINAHGRDLVERLKDLSNVPYFQYVNEVSAMPSSMMYTEASSEISEHDSTDSIDSQAEFYKETTAIAAISLGCVGMVLVSLGIAKFMMMRRSNVMWEDDCGSSKGTDVMSRCSNCSSAQSEPHEYNLVQGFRNSREESGERPNAFAGGESFTTTNTLNGGYGTRNKRSGKYSEVNRRKSSSSSGQDNWNKSILEFDQNSISRQCDAPLKEEDETTQGEEEMITFSYEADDDDADDVTVGTSHCRENDKNSHTTEEHSLHQQKSIATVYDDDITSDTTGNQEYEKKKQRRKDDKKRSHSHSSSKTTSGKSESSKTRRSMSKLKVEDYDGIKRDCFAPPGKLGVAIDTGPGGVGPIVHKLKAGSPLEGILHQGDRIMAIDDVDTRYMSASNVTKMMVRRMDSQRKISYMTAGV